MGASNLWTDERRKFILDHYYMTPTKTLTEMFNKEFGLNVSPVIIKSYKGRNKLKSGISGRFEKGQVPYSKGKKMSPEVYERIKHTFFKKGTIPPKQAPVGTEVIRSDGYIKVKIADPNVWKAKHRLVWEAVNGPIPANSKIVFLDGDKLNCELSNLKLVSKQASLIMNRNNMNYDNVELNDLASNTAELMAKRFEAINKRKGKGKIEKP